MPMRLAAELYQSCEIGQGQLAARAGGLYYFQAGTSNHEAIR